MNAICINSQESIYKFDYLSVIDGLSSNVITSIYKDSKGYIWIGTTTGLNRYNAYAVKNYLSNPNDSTSLINDHILCIYESKDRKLWIGTSNGLCKYNYHTDDFEHIGLFENTNDHVKNITSFVETEDQCLWIGSNYGIFKLNLLTNKIIHEFGSESSLSSSAISALCLDTNNQLLIGSNSSYVDVLNLKTQKLSHIPFEGSEHLDQAVHKVVRIICDDDNSMWMVVIGSGLLKFNPKLNAFKRIPIELDKLETPFINDFLKYSDDKFLLFTNSGLIIFNKKTNSFKHVEMQKNQNNSLNTNRLICGYIDNNNIWIGTHNSGLNIYKSNKYKFHNFANYLSEPKLCSSILDLTITDEGKILWIATDGEGIFRYNIESGNLKHFTKESAKQGSNSISSIIKDKNGCYWIGSYWGGLTVLNDGNTKSTQSFAQIDQIPNLNNITCLSKDDHDNIFAGTLDEGLMRYNQNTGIIKIYKKSVNQNSLSDNFIFDLLVDDNVLWIATAGAGVNAFDLNTEYFKNYIAKNPGSQGLAGNKIYCIFKDSQQNLWFGTNKGLSLYSKVQDSFISFGRNEGLIDNNIISLNEDNNGYLWLASNRGITKLRYIDSTIRDICSYDWNDGIESGSFQLNSSCKLPDGSILFGGAKGICFFSPDDIKKDTSQSPIIISNIKIQNQNIYKSDSINGRVLYTTNIDEVNELIFKYQEKTISFEFALLHYITPENNRYAYRLDGFEKDWNYLDPGQRTATYTNLREGTYVLKVKGANQDGHWSTEELSINIIVLPPWFRTWWACLIYFTIAILLSVAFRYMLVLKLRYEHIQIISKKEQEQEKAKLKLFMNISHEFRTPLTLILAPLNDLIHSQLKPNIKSMIELTYRNAKRLQILIDQLLDLRKIGTEKYELNLRNGNIIAFFHSIFEAFDDLAKRHSIDYSFHPKIQNLFCAFDRNIVDKVMFNVISNAFKYTPYGGKISIDIIKEDDAGAGILVVNVTDTGIGIPSEKREKIFDRFYRIESNNVKTDSGTGIGLALSKELIEIHKGSISVDSKVNFGSTFTIKIPLIKSFEKFTNELIETKEKTSIQVSADYLFEDNIEKSEDDIVFEERVIGENEKKAYIYIIDDNQDLRIYLRKQLQNEFLVSTFSNGDEAIKKAIEELPDLIILDVMMPVMDGFTLSKEIRSNQRTCHIPIIMLTAKSSEEFQIEGFETGADDYVIKPFSYPVLKARIDTILLNRQKIWEKFRKEKFLPPKNLIKGEKDKQFIQKVIDIINQNIANPDLGNKILCAELALSKTQLYRKMNSLTGSTVHEFIKIIRLKKSAELLQDETLNISDVADRVGFRYLPNFSSAFKNYFNISPKEYVNKLMHDKNNSNVENN